MAQSANIKNSHLLPLKIYWSSRSPFVRKVMITIHELGLSEHVTTEAVHIEGFTPQTALEKYNPIGKIPTLVAADDTVIYDSDAIIDFLDAHFGDRSLCTSEYPQRLNLLRRTTLAQAAIEKSLNFVVAKFQKNAFNIEIPGQLSAYLRSVTLAVDSFENNINEWRDLPLDAGHIAVATMLGYLDFRLGNDFNWREGRPGIAAWHAEFAKRPSYINTEFSDPKGVFK